MKDPICINETGGKACGHPTSKHDSGGACRAAWCDCSKLVTESFIENAAPVPAQPEMRESLGECDVTDLRSPLTESEVDGPTAAEHSAPTCPDCEFGSPIIQCDEPGIWHGTSLGPHLCRKSPNHPMSSSVLFRPDANVNPDPLLAFNVETASFADLAVWAYKIQQQYRKLKESSL